MSSLRNGLLLSDISIGARKAGLRRAGLKLIAVEDLDILRVGEAGEAARRRQLAKVVRLVAEQLANTPAVARKSYVHEVVVEAFTTERLDTAYRRTTGAKNRRRIENTLRRLIDGPRRPNGAEKIRPKSKCNKPECGK